MKSFYASILSCLIATLALPTLLEAKSANKEESIDLSILSQRAGLYNYLNLEQRAQLVQAEQLIESARSDMRSAEYLINRKSSTFVTKKEAQQANERGEALKAASEAKINDAQKKVVELLQIALELRESRIQPIQSAKKLALQTMPYRDAIQAAAKEALSACWDNNYKNIFFDQAFVLSNDGYAPAEKDQSDAIYQQLIELDGTRFSVTQPKELKIEAFDSRLSIRFADFELYKNDTSAFLAVSILKIDDGRELLRVEAFDLSSHTVIAYQLIQLSKDEEASIEPFEIQFEDEKQMIDKLASLKEPYIFAIDFQGETNHSSSILAPAALKYFLKNTSSLEIAESDFLAHAYLSSAEAINQLVGEENAAFKLVESEEEMGVYSVSARSYKKNQSIPVGQLSF